MVIPGELWKKMNVSERNTIGGLGAISALCGILTAVGFQPSIKHHTQSYFDMGDESYHAAQGVLLFVGMLVLFALKLYAATLEEKQKEKPAAQAKSPVMLSKSPQPAPVPAIAAATATAHTSELESGRQSKKRRLD